TADRDYAFCQYPSASELGQGVARREGRVTCGSHWCTVAATARGVMDAPEGRRMDAQGDDVELGPYGNGRLPEGIRTRIVPDVNGMTTHVLEAGTTGDPVVLLVHGFPELGYSWRNQILPLAAAGYHVLAPDLRGFGRTTGWDERYEADLREHGLLNKTRD